MFAGKSPLHPSCNHVVPTIKCRSSGPLGALLSSPALDVRLLTALQVLQGSAMARDMVRGGSTQVPARVREGGGVGRRKEGVKY